YHRVFCHVGFFCLRDHVIDKRAGLGCRSWFVCLLAGECLGGQFIRSVRNCETYPMETTIQSNPNLGIATLPFGTTPVLRPTGQPEFSPTGRVLLSWLKSVPF